MSTLYYVNFYRHDKKIDDVKKVHTATAEDAIAQVMQASEKHGVKISDIFAIANGSTFHTLWKVHFYNNKTNTEITTELNSNTSKDAVSQVIQASERNNVKISNISVSVDGSTGSQRFCDVCLISEASHGIKGKFVCKAHLNAV
jgi:predicted amino acid dehydrogenase